MKMTKRTTILKDKAGKVKLPRARTVLPPVPERFRKQSLESKTEASLQNVPRITNETVAEHRETVLKGARKYKYPLEHSKHMIVKITSAVLGVALVTFLVYTLLSLYKFQSTSEFTYRITQVVPFPVAKVGSNFVSYESYLFELRRYMHYYETQQKVDFDTDRGKGQLAAYKPQALQKVIDELYVKKLAKENGVSVSNSEVDAAVSALRIQNQLGNDDRELAAVTQKFFNWSLGDLKRRVKSELLAQKVAAKLDKAAYDKAQDVLKQVRGGGDFAALAGQYSDDAGTKGNGGQYADTAITVSTTSVHPTIVGQLQRMKVGDVSEVITTPTAFEIVKLLSDEGGKYKAAHIEVKFRPVTDFTAPLAKKQPSQRFITVEDIPAAPASNPQ